jgi:hypothetical protein
MRRSPVFGEIPYQLSAVGAPERSHSKVSEEDDDDGRGDEGAVVGAVRVAEASAPKGRGEDQDRKKEEDAGDLEPNLSPDTLKGFEESYEAAAEV